MKKITIAALLIISQSAFAQVTSEELKKEITPLIKKIEVLETKATKQGKEIEGLNLKLSTTNKQIDSLWYYWCFAGNFTFGRFVFLLEKKARYRQVGINQ